MKYIYTNEFLLNELKRYYNEYNKIPTIKDFDYNKDFPSKQIYKNRFGSWNNALTIVGFDIKLHNYSKEFLISELKRYYNENGKVPTEQNFISNKNFPSVKAYINHFKTWNNALMAANLCINEINNKLTGDECCYKCGSNHTSLSGWHINNNKRICDKCYASNRNYLYGMLDPNSKTGIGVITEHVVYEVLGDCEKYNTIDNFNSDYDLASENYNNINVKSSKLHDNHKTSQYWQFHKYETAKIPNYYICIGFDKNRSKILKVWLIHGNSKLIIKSGINIANSEKGLERAKQYEVDPFPYNEVYQNLDITTLPEFRNINVGEIYA